MRLTRVRETPRVTKPYSEAQWQDILAMGAAVDQALAAGNVRLTMGGEPTFVAASDFDEPEWTTDALGPTKQRFAAKLMQRLRERWAPGSALQNVSGKHYPGEQLPRWALYAHWRRDGEPVWRDPSLLAATEDVDTASAADAQRFCAALAERLQVDPSLINPAYEDVHYYLWREHRLPENVHVDDAKLGDPMERARLARVFGHGLGAPVGCVLPLRRAIRGEVRVWQSAQVVLPRRYICSCSRAIHRSASGCRWTACRGKTRTRSNTRPSLILSRRMRRCRRFSRFSPWRPPASWARRRGVPSRGTGGFRSLATASRMQCAPRSASSRAMV